MYGPIPGRSPDISHLRYRPPRIGVTVDAAERGTSRDIPDVPLFRSVSSPELLNDYNAILSQYSGRTPRPANHVRDFLDCVKTRRTTVANPEVMLRAMSICLAADICEQLQRNLTLDLRTYEFVNDPEASLLRSRPVRGPWHI